MYLLIMLLVCCNDGTRPNCSLFDLPNISDLGRIHPWDRLYCLVMTFHCMTCLQSNVRAFYKLNYDNEDQGTNRFLFWIGFIGTFLLPPVGYFDEKMVPILHPCLATGFFICFILYSLTALSVLVKR